jgi:hypothetical protein
MAKDDPVGVECSIRIEASPVRILAAFFDARALGAWWDVWNAVATPRPLGAYALEWRPSVDADELLGRLGGVLHGTVIDFQPKQGFLVADLYWLPPDGEPIGPMAMEVTCTPERKSSGTGQATLLHVAQRGLDDSPRWLRYYELAGTGLPRALETMKRYLEQGRGAWDLRAYAE